MISGNFQQPPFVSPLLYAGNTIVFRQQQQAMDYMPKIKPGIGQTP
jgi:hypothetical protein